MRLIIPELETDRHPDLALIFRGASLDDFGQRRPVLAVEVVSPGKRARKRDYVAKREEYLTLGFLREYWIVDLRLRQVMVLVRRDEGGASVWEERVFRGEEIIGTDLLPGFEGRVADLWADVEPAGNGNEVS